MSSEAKLAIVLKCPSDDASGLANALTSYSYAQDVISPPYYNTFCISAGPPDSQTDGVIGGAAAVTLHNTLQPVQDPLLTAAQLTPPSAGRFFFK